MTRAVQKPDTGVFLSLVSLAAHLGKGYIIVSQKKLLERVRGTTGYRTMSRRTLNRHLAGLVRLSFINRQRRSKKNRDGVWRRASTLYTFAEHGILWIKRYRQASSIVLGRPRAPEMAHSQKTLSSSEVRHAVGNSSTAQRRQGRSRPPQAGARNGPRGERGRTRH